MAQKTAEIVARVVDLLTPLGSEDRQRVVQASLTLLGETATRASGAEDLDSNDVVAGDMPVRARTWMQKNGVTADEIQEVFHFTNEGVEVIASEMPGRNASEKTLNAYVLTGLAKLFADGSPTFEDKAARTLCETSGCYDNTNHSKYVKNKGNAFSGSKSKGWTLTAPGLNRGATLVKELGKAAIA